jgi:hypothetical protein
MTTKNNSMSTQTSSIQTFTIAVVVVVDEEDSVVGVVTVCVELPVCTDEMIGIVVVDFIGASVVTF